jgi:hypothetical protein
MTDTSDKWRRRAAELRRMADEIKEPKARSDVLKLAIDWELMADRERAREHAPSPRSK